MSGSPNIRKADGEVVKSIREAYEPCLASVLITAFLEKKSAGKHVVFESACWAGYDRRRGVGMALDQVKNGRGLGALRANVNDRWGLGVGAA